MKLAVIMAMALATVTIADSASAAARKHGHRHQAGKVGIGKGVAAKSLASKKVKGIGASQPATQGIIMRDGGVCDPIRHMGC